VRCVLAPVPVLPCDDAALALRCPDLVMAAPFDLRADAGPSGKRVVLRMANRIVNVGAGPLEIFGQRSGPRTMEARQVIADASGRRRRYATGGTLEYTSVPTRGGDYWKFRDAARFELWRLDPAGRRVGLVRTSPKLNYCLRDLQRRRRVAGIPRYRRFPACNQTNTKLEVTLGISRGWGDGYPADYPLNWIDVTGRRGCFVVLMRADPLRHVLESDETNNVSARVVRLPYRPGPQGCPAYVAGPPPSSPATGR
jgi:hypothetical protein